VGKIRSNFVGSQFVVYDTGVNPKKLRGGISDNVREELAAISYKSALLGKKKPGPRAMQIVLPHVKDHSGILKHVPCKPMTEAQGLRSLTDHFSQTTSSVGKEPLVTVYTNKNAVWNQKMKSYVLDFNNRVGQASVKNFQMVPSHDSNELVLQFGRAADDNRFNVDFRHPLSPLQAFSICVTSLDYKICSE